MKGENNVRGYVLATKMLVDEKRKVHFMYREKTDDSRDSGWRFFCGDESEEYLNNPDHIAIYDVRNIVSLDDSIIPYLEEKPEVAFERVGEEGTFVLSKDYSFGKE